MTRKVKTIDLTGPQKGATQSQAFTVIAVNVETIIWDEKGENYRPYSVTYMDAESQAFYSDSSVWRSKIVLIKTNYNLTYNRIQLVFNQYFFNGKKPRGGNKARPA